MIRRIAFVLGFMPLLIGGFFYWLVTGRSAFELIAKFDRWANG